MKKGNLSLRLYQLAKWIDNQCTIADIGTDHGYLPYYLLDNQSISRAICCDINSGPLQNAKGTFSGARFKDKVDFRLGSGIEPLESSEVDYVVIAGMGGGLIVDILNKNISKSYSFKGFYLQPQTEQDVLRTWLLKNGFTIVNDFCVFEDEKYYEGLFVVPPKPLDTELPNGLFNEGDLIVYNQSSDKEFGHRIHRDSISIYKDYLAFKRRKYEMILSKLTEAGLSEKNSEKANLCREKLSDIDKLIQ